MGGIKTEKLRFFHQSVVDKSDKIADDPHMPDMIPDENTGETIYYGSPSNTPDRYVEELVVGGQVMMMVGGQVIMVVGWWGE